MKHVSDQHKRYRSKVWNNNDKKEDLTPPLNSEDGQYDYFLYDENNNLIDHKLKAS